MQQSVATGKKSAFAERDLIYIGTPGETFSNDEKLPSLPVPPLKQTLLKYIDSVRPHATDKELAKTQEIIDRFEKGIGRKLHNQLLQLASERKNWLERWWEDVAYLSVRFPLIPYLNMIGGIPFDEQTKPNREKWLEKAGIQLHYQSQFYCLLRREQLRAFVNRNEPWNMEQFRRLFNTTRIPGEEKDEVKSYFQTISSGKSCPKHVVVFCQGYIFSFDIVDDNEEPLTAPEITKQLQSIYDWCQASVEGPGIAALTAANRTTWSKNRTLLSELHPINKHCLEQIDSAIITVTLDNEEPGELSSLQKACISGDCSNRWADKASSTFIFRNSLVGGSSDHAPFDGLVPMAYAHYVYLSVIGCEGVWQGPQKIRDIPKPQKLEFHIDDTLENEIQMAKDSYNALCENLQSKYANFNLYGKAFTKPFNIRPEAYVQLALQLGYYRLHGRPGSTYMTASTRQYYHGRTETCRTCTPEVISWILTMDDPEKSVSEKVRLMYKAVDKFNELLTDCMSSKGCDRHLLGLYMIAQEEGLPIPELFQDPSYSKSGGGGNFVLSTSCSGYTPLSGCVAPMCEEGYGCFYSIENHRMTFQLSAYNHYKETCCEKLYSNIDTALMDMQQLLLSAKL